MKKQPLLILVICFILGIFFQDKFSLDANYIYSIIGICILIVITTFFKSFIFYKSKPYLLGLMFFGIGVILHFLNSSSPQNVSVSGNETIIFKVSKKLNSNEKNRKYEVEAQAKKEKFNAILYIPKDEKELDFNHYYKAETYITKPKSPQYDFQFNYAQYLKRKDIEYQVYVNDRVSLAKRNDLKFNERFSQKRLEVLQNIDQTEISTKSKEFLKGIILADRTETDITGF